MTTDTTLPRLMNADAVADYLDMGRTTFDTKRKMLEGTGFPKPVLPRDEFGSAKWDRHAIDAWLDNRSGLNDEIRATPSAPAIDWESKLMNRAQALAEPRP